MKEDEVLAAIDGVPAGAAKTAAAKAAPARAVTKSKTATRKGR